MHDTAPTVASLDIDTLARRFAIPGQLRLSAGPGGLPMLDIENSAASARVSLYGGQVLTYTPVGDAPLLFLSERAYYAEGKAIKGGIPVCWPWFGADPQDQGRPAHGFARNSLWTLAATKRVSESHTRITMRLGDSNVTRTLWPHAFELLLTVDVGDTLGVTLETRNTGDQPFTITQALHTYFAVAAIDRVSVEGLDGCSYLDKVQDFATSTQAGAVTFGGEVDRVYQGVGSVLHIVDAGGGRRIRIDAEGSHTAVVWNPWKAISAAMADLADDDYRRLVCVETANAASEVIEVAAGASYRLMAEYRIEA